jgi:hypothetical protein
VFLAELKAIVSSSDNNWYIHLHDFPNSLPVYLEKIVILKVSMRTDRHGHDAVASAAGICDDIVGYGIEGLKHIKKFHRWSHDDRNKSSRLGDAVLLSYGFTGSTSAVIMSRMVLSRQNALMCS